MKRRGAREAREAGLTLIELSVAMLIFVLLSAVALSAIVVVSRNQVRVADRGERLEQLRASLATLQRQVRSGNVIADPALYVDPAYKDRLLTVYTQANGAQKCVQWWVAPDTASSGRYKLLSRSWAPDWATSGKYTAWSSVAVNLMVRSGEKPFSAPVATDVTYGRLINVALTESGSDRGSADVSISSTLTGRNTQYGFDPLACSSGPSL